MRKKLLFIPILCGMLTGLISSCSGADTVIIWVGNESVDYYKKVAAQYMEDHPEFEYRIDIKGTDTGTNAAALLADNTACGDIVTVAHDNIGKLSQGGYIKPILDESLLEQIKNDNPDTFVTSVTNYLGAKEDDRFKYIFGSPYISQALVLYYNKKYVTDEEAKTFEGLTAASLRASQGKEERVAGWTVTGTDGFNYSYNLLARQLPENTTTLKIYEGGQLKNCYATGDDSVASLRWAQRNYKEGNFTFTGSSPWNLFLQQERCLSVIGGAWHFNAFIKSVGEENVGIAEIPTYTLKAEDVAGSSMQAGTIMHGGSFTDCKCFVINSASKGYKYLAIESLVKYLSTKEVQNGSFVEAGNVPAYSGASEFVEQAYNEGKITANLYNLATAQNKMSSYGIPQPFTNGNLNAFYYQKNAPKIYENAVKNNVKDEEYGSYEGCLSALYRMERVWITSLDPGYGKLPKDYVPKE